MDNSNLFLPFFRVRLKTLFYFFTKTKVFFTFFRLGFTNFSTFTGAIVRLMVRPVK